MIVDNLGITLKVLAQTINFGKEKGRGRSPVPSLPHRSHVRIHRTTRAVNLLQQSIDLLNEVEVEIELVRRGVIIQPLNDLRICGKPRVVLDSRVFDLHLSLEPVQRAVDNEIERIQTVFHNTDVHVEL